MATQYGRGGGRRGAAAESKRHNQPFSVVKALLKIMERISRSTNFFFLYTHSPRPLSTGHRSRQKPADFFFFFAVLRNLTRFDHRIFFPEYQLRSHCRRFVKGYPVSRWKINFLRPPGGPSRAEKHDGTHNFTSLMCIYNIYIYLCYKKYIYILYSHIPIVIRVSVV